MYLHESQPKPGGTAHGLTPVSVNGENYGGTCHE